MKVFFIYKTLAHPELAGNYVQPFTLEERLAHAKQAQTQLGATIPWIVDAMDNRLKHALGDRPNSGFVIDPKGKIVRKRAWSHPALVRRDLEELVGKAAQFTKEEDIALKLKLPLKVPAERGTVVRIARPRMQAISMEPEIEKNGLPFYAKLRVEGDAGLLKSGEGKLYLGFHLDPFHNAHWNNLTAPLKYEIKLPPEVELDQASGTAPKMKVVSDSDPREFLLDVKAWPEDQPLKLTVTYSACVGDLTCYSMKQHYTLRRKHDKDGGGARGDGAGLWAPEEFLKQTLVADKDGDGKLSRVEARGLVAAHFDRFDADQDGRLDAEEIKNVVVWLNTHHAPATTAKLK